jgi:hypothetical protein
MYHITRLNCLMNNTFNVCTITVFAFILILYMGISNGSMLVPNAILQARIQSNVVLSTELAYSQRNILEHANSVIT